ncbi:MAG: flagellar motor switch protein FliN [bacterium]|nr:flagellar motor switch protein FliN [bacterium]
MDNTPHGFEDPLSDIDPIMEQAFSVSASDYRSQQEPASEPLNATATPVSSETYDDSDFSDDDFDNTPLSEEIAQPASDDLSDLSDDLFAPEPSYAPSPAAAPAAVAHNEPEHQSRPFSEPAPSFDSRPQAEPAHFYSSPIEDIPQPGDNFMQGPSYQDTVSSQEPSYSESFVTPPSNPYASAPAASQQEPAQSYAPSDSHMAVPAPPPSAPPSMGAPANNPDNGNGNALNYVEFPDLQDAAIEGRKIEDGVLSSIPVKVSVELGRSHLSLQEVYELTEGSIIELERLVGEPLDLVINGQVIAQGEVVAIDNKYGLRIKNLTSNKTVA